MNKKTVPLLVAAILLAGIFAGIAIAEVPVQIKKLEKEYQITEKNYKETKRVYEIARAGQQDAVQRYREIKAAEKDPEVLQSAAKEYVLDSIDAMIAKLEVLKVNAERAEQQGYAPFNGVERINTHILNLEQIKKDVNNADTPQELKDAVKELRSGWKVTKKEAKYFVSRTANNRIENFLIKADRVSVKLETVVEQLESSRADTANLTQNLEMFKKEVEAANESYKKAREIHQGETGFDSTGCIINDASSDASLREANEYMIEAREHIRQANLILKDIFKEVKESRSAVFLNGTGSLYAEGNGRAAIFGNVTINLSAENATIVVSRNAEVTVNGNGTRVELENGNIKYQGYGSFDVSGEQIHFAISGNDIVLEAAGTGRVLLCGNGTYHIDNTDSDLQGAIHQWTAPYAIQGTMFGQQPQPQQQKNGWRR
ncbi:MAG: hypothetical protein LAKADJCE_00866 [Candidatus Argoarchaeum ethanivorans]|uniref:DUF5667 domain-containing protein n=1 Tax=Candidatus Argoarchaeum ethanivorans TaxID=2608793 RepID=A0A811TJI8_9EURY|nr:MAG: hypothetical protein LAKADJCE_00866 [Candidatus Argoarchaeum ethanivorans]